MKKPLFSMLACTAIMSMSALGAYAHDVSVYLKKSNGEPYANATIRYQLNSGGVTTVGTTDINGKVIKTGVSGGGHKFSATVNATSFTTSPMVVSNDTAITLYTTKVVVASYNSAGQPLAEVKSRFHGSSVIFLGESDAGGEINSELFPGSRPISSEYKGTSNMQTIMVAGDGHTFGQSTTVETYTSEVKFTASSHNNAKVPGVQIRYTSGGSTTNQSGNTDANGEKVIELYPGTYTFNGAFNGTGKTWSIAVAGTGTAAGSTQLENVLLSRVKFHNAGTVKYPVPGSADKTISGETYYMFPKTYTLKFGAYSRTVDISGANYEKAAAVIVLKDNTGNLLGINSIRGGVGSSISYHVPSGSVSNETPGVWIDISNYNANTSRVYEVKKNGTIATQTKNLMTSNIFDFQTGVLTLRLQKCNGDGIEGGTIRGGYTPDVNATPAISYHWSANEVSSNATDANGNTSMQVFPGKFILEMKTKASLEQKIVTVAGSENVTWTTTNVKMNYKGTGSSLAYGKGTASTWWSYPASGEELLPGQLVFNFVDNGSNLVTIDIPAQCTPFVKTAVIARLKNSSNAALSGGTVSYYQGGWYNVANATAANGNTVVLLDGSPSTATVTMNYLGTAQQKSNINIASVGNVITWQTSLITMSLVDVNNNPIEADANSLSYYAGGWKTFGNGNTTGGSASMELLAGTSYSYSMRLNGSGEQRSSWNTVTNPVIPFTASKVKINYIGANCEPVAGAAASYYAGGWRSLGTTDANGNSNEVDMLPGGNYSFKVGPMPQVNGVSIGLNQEQTVDFTSCVNMNLRMANPDSEGEAVENIMSIQKLELYPNPATTELNIRLIADNSDVSVFAMDGRMVHHQVYNTGLSTVNISGFAQGTYFVKVRNGNNVETFKITKQ